MVYQCFEDMGYSSSGDTEVSCQIGLGFDAIGADEGLPLDSMLSSFCFDLGL